jgi:16S rRNA (cytidine1402-2'-O)-methyltransferase|tara:strand:+ start:166 stop:579 length:414 start_codon:yes stop_codon:yes gene_type:complete
MESLRIQTIYALRYHRLFLTLSLTFFFLPQVHEEFWRGTLSGAVAEFSERKPRGEITLVVQGVGPNGGFGGVGTSETIANTFGTSAEDMEELMESFLKKMILDEGVSPSDAAKRVSKELGVRKKEAYVLALRLAGKQ